MMTNLKTANSGKTDNGQLDYGVMFSSHDKQRDTRRHSATIIAQMLRSYIKPDSVIDLGCGMGFFLAAMAEHGAEVQGVDGPWVQGLNNEIPNKFYEIHDLNQPYKNKKRYDLAVSLEVAEHLEPSRSDDFVQELTALSDHVLFSAAIPNQKGRGHINTQWQEFWAARFEIQGFRCYDPFRRRLIGIEKVSPWFTQNLLLYIKDGTQVSKTLAEHEIPAKAASYILPKGYNRRVNFLVEKVKKTSIAN